MTCSQILVIFSTLEKKVGKTKTKRKKCANERGKGKKLKKKKRKITT